MGQRDMDIDALIRGAQAGRADCFDELIDLYANRLYGYFYRSSGSATVAEDLVQDVFLRLIRAIKRYDHREQFEAFLFRIAGNLNRDRIRKSRRSKERSLALEEDQLPALTMADAHIHEPLAALEQAEHIDAMQAAMARLPAAEREVIVLRHFSELSFGEIASIMDTPLGTALARAHRGLKKLRSMLEDLVSD
ncbi:MAG: sigma-70 family RNA polymerase sigma factor [Planctomycetes bacterium]|nr:sigma-70 family RNA polymerase sigma factor [Planctomycetota bacterium]